MAVLFIFVCTAVGTASKDGGITEVWNYGLTEVMNARNNNGLRRGALFSLFVTSYIPLFAIVIGKQVKDGWEYMNWGGWNMEALRCFVTHFGMSLALSTITIAGCVGIIGKQPF